jgi:hypothetical protein
MIKKVGGVAGHLRFGNNDDGGASVCVGRTHIRRLICAEPVATSCLLPPRQQCH